jgi:AbiTii
MLLVELAETDVLAKRRATATNETAMALLTEIQASLMQQGQQIGPILLKLRFLASRLGSGPLEEWVKHESEGYPRATEVPDYRRIAVSYTGTFFGPFGSGIENAPIPPFLIEKFCGKNGNYPVDKTRC